MTAAAIIAAVRAAGADLMLDGGRPVIRRGSRLSPALMVAVREHRDAIIAEIERSPTPAAQLPLFAAPRKPEPPMSFLDAQEAKFFAVCREFGIEVPR